MKIIPKVLITAGVVAGIGVSAVPLTSYATQSSSSQTTTVSVTVNDSISITGASSLDLGTLTPGQTTASGKSLTLTVKSNNSSGYVVNATLAALVNGTNTIPVGTVSAGTNAFGIATSDASWGNTSSIGTKNTASASAGDTYTVYMAASASTTLANGTYSGTQTFTATNNGSV